MKDKTKRGLIIGTGLVLSVALIFLIAEQMKPAPVIDDPLPSASSQTTDVVVDDKVDNTEKEEIVVPPIEIFEEEPKIDDQGTEQEIQSTPEKPEPTEDELKNKTQTPTGEKVEYTEPTDDELKNPTTPPTTQPEAVTPPAPPSNQGGGLPGFDNVPDMGENKGTFVDGDGDINKQVGQMG